MTHSRSHVAGNSLAETSQKGTINVMWFRAFSKCDNEQEFLKSKESRRKLIGQVWGFRLEVKGICVKLGSDIGECRGLNRKEGKPERSWNGKHSKKRH